MIDKQTNKVVLTRTLMRAVISVGIVLMEIHPAHADAIGTAMDALQGWLTTTAGVGLLGIGGTIVGIQIAMDNPNSWEKGKSWVIGGGVIFLIKAFITLIRQWTGQ